MISGVILIFSLMEPCVLFLATCLILSGVPCIFLGALGLEVKLDFLVKGKSSSWTGDFCSWCFLCVVVFGILNLLGAGFVALACVAVGPVVAAGVVFLVGLIALTDVVGAVGFVALTDVVVAVGFVALTDVVGAVGFVALTDVVGAVGFVALTDVVCMVGLAALTECVCVWMFFL